VADCQGRRTGACIQCHQVTLTHTRLASGATDTYICLPLGSLPDVSSLKLMQLVMSSA
jgi:hypothetical protein